ncbi:MAG: MBL fold metallo-hydrolase [Bdellovibrionales bacterium]|nr:MBL fold metallo-hydrolase [Bdellovibrionales bacterium]
MGLYFKQVELGPMANYVYLIGDTETKEMAVVDPAWDLPAIYSIAEQEGMQITKAFITHGHPDHINAVEDLINEKNAQVYMHKEEVPWIKGWKETAIGTETGDEIAIGNQKIKVIHTPGHTEGSQCFMFGEKMLSGDTLFLDGCGRTDLPGGNAEKLYYTFHDIIKNLPKQTIIYPGHNYAHDHCQSLEQQCQTNPYLRAHTKDEFISLIKPGFRSL